MKLGAWSWEVGGWRLELGAWRLELGAWGWENRDAGLGKVLSGKLLYDGRFLGAGSEGVFRL